MPFANASEQGRLVKSETITLANAGDSSTSMFSTANIGDDFVIIANTGAVNTVGAVTGEVQVSHDKQTWSTLTSSLISSVDTATVAAHYDASAEGDAPYYRVTFTSAADDSSTDIEVVVILP